MIFAPLFTWVIIKPFLLIGGIVGLTHLVRWIGKDIWDKWNNLDK